MLISYLIAAFLFLTGTDNRNFVLENYLSEMLKNYSRWEYEIVSYPKDLDDSNCKYSVSKASEFKVSNSYCHIPVEIIKNGSIKLNSVITVKLKLYQNILVINREIKKGEQLSINFFDEKEMEIQQLNDEPFLMATDIEFYRSRISLKPGRILTKSMIDRLPTIKCGDKVSATLVKGLVSISFDAVSKEEGFKGDIIRIEGFDRRIFKAKVEDFNNVLIVE
jgi:flagella basal body P-ring formation protein FlgA